MRRDVKAEKWVICAPNQLLRPVSALGQAEVSWSPARSLRVIAVTNQWMVDLYEGPRFVWPIVGGNTTPNHPLLHSIT